MSVMINAVVATVAAAIVVSLVSSRLGRADDTSAVLSRRFSPNATVVIPGAWRVPRTPEMRRRGVPGHLSRAFKQRLDRGVRVAAAAGIGNVVLSGGNSDSVLARKWIVERFGAGIPQPHSTDDLETADVINCTLRVATDGDSDDDRHERPAPGDNERDRAAPLVALRLWVENRSTTTATNAEFTAALLDRPNSPLGAHGEVVVVSSPYHLPRCRVFFGRHLPTRERYFIASASQEFQWLLPPDPAWIDVRLFFADETVPPGVLCQRPHCIIVRHPRAPFGYLLPRSVLTFVHSLVASWRAFNGVLILTLWSTPAGAWAREVGAFASNFASHRFELADLRHV